MQDALVVVGRDDAHLTKHIAAGFRALEVSRLHMVVVESCARRQTLGPLERLYRWLDGRLFDRRNAVPRAVDAVCTGTDELDPLVVHKGLGADHIERSVADVHALVALAEAGAPRVVLDLTGQVTTAQCNGADLLSLKFGDGAEATSLQQAVRDRIGVPHGALSVTVARAAAQGSRKQVFGARVFLDHRSFRRSGQLAALKIAPIVIAALKRTDRGVHDGARSGAGPHPRPRTAVQLLSKSARAVASKLLGRVQWQIQLYRGGEAGRSLGEPWATLKPPREEFWADPFVIAHRDRAVVFFEALRYRENKGFIACIEVEPDGSHGAPTVVLDRPWHQSYPYVFQVDGQWYMVPESGANLSVTLYRCTEFPARWQEVCTLVEGVALYDASIVRWNDKWWLFAAHGLPGASTYDELHVYWAEDLFGPWEPHALNPVKIDAGSARPAGAPVVIDGKLIRPAQDCRNRYGDAVSFQHVVQLDAESFSEVPYEPEAIRAQMAGISLLHTYNVQHEITVIDCASTASTLV